MAEVDGAKAAIEILEDLWDDSGLAPIFGAARGTNLFRTRLPDQPDEVIAAFNSDPRPRHTFGIPGAIVEQAVRIYVRASSGARATTLAQRALQTLTSSNRAVAGGTVLQALAETHPSPSARDTRDRMIMVFTMTLWTVAT